MELDLQRRRDLGGILDTAFSLLRAHPGPLLLVTLAVVLPADLLVLGAGLGWLWSGWSDGGSVEELVVPAMAQWLVVTPLVTAMVVHVVLAVAAGGELRRGEAVRAGLDVFPALLGAMLLVAVGVGLGLLALVVPAVVVAIHWAVVPQAVVVEDARGTGALRRSWRLVRGHAWWTFAVLLVINLVASLLAAAVTFPLQVLAEALDVQAVALLGTIVGHLITLPLVAVASTLLYFGLRARHGEEAGPQLPGRSAAEGGEQRDAFGREADPAGAPPPVAPPPPAAPPPPSAPSPPADDGEWARREREGWRPPTPGG